MALLRWDYVASPASRRGEVREVARDPWQDKCGQKRDDGQQGGRFARRGPPSAGYRNALWSCFARHRPAGSEGTTANLGNVGMALRVLGKPVILPLTRSPVQAQGRRALSRGDDRHDDHYLDCGHSFEKTVTREIAAAKLKSVLSGIQRNSLIRWKKFSVRSDFVCLVERK